MGIINKKSENMSKNEKEFIKNLKKLGKGATFNQVAQLFNEYKSSISISKFITLYEQFKKDSLPELNSLNFLKNLSTNELIEFSKNMKIPKETLNSVLKNYKPNESAKVLGAVLKTEFSADKNIKKTYESSIIQSDSTLANQEFETDISKFLSAFKEKYLSQYLSDIKKMSEEEAKEYLQTKMEPLIQYVVDAFKSGYSYVGKSPQRQDKMAYERIARTQIIEDQFVVMFGEVIDSKIKEIAATGKALDEDSKEKIQASIISYGRIEEAKQRIEKRTAVYNEAVEKKQKKTAEFTDKNAESIAQQTEKLEKSTSRNKAINAYYDATEQLRGLMGQLDKINAKKEKEINFESFLDDEYSISKAYRELTTPKTESDEETNSIGKFAKFAFSYKQELEGKSDEELRKIADEIKKLREELEKANKSTSENSGSQPGE